MRVARRRQHLIAAPFVPVALQQERRYVVRLDRQCLLDGHELTVRIAGPAADTGERQPRNQVTRVGRQRALERLGGLVPAFVVRKLDGLLDEQRRRTEVRRLFSRNAHS